METFDIQDLPKATEEELWGLMKLVDLKIDGGNTALNMMRTTRQAEGVPKVAADQALAYEGAVVKSLNYWRMEKKLLEQTIKDRYR